MTSSYFENGKARYVMEAAIHMIHGMNLEIVSEGIRLHLDIQKQDVIASVLLILKPKCLRGGKTLDLS